VEKTSENSKLQKELIDDSFYVEQKSYGLWDSKDKDGNGLITSLTKESCISATRFYLKGRQEGWTESKTYSGEVGGKL
jgi:hypothetical protein